MSQALLEQLVARLQQPLPGERTMRRFEPELAYGRHFGAPRWNARRAAVVALLYPRDDRWVLPLIVRPAGAGHHAGQVSLPGGAIEAGETSVDAALRELAEEICVPPQSVNIAGPLTTLYVSGSNFVVQPWVGVANEPPTFTCNPSEVVEVLELSATHLADPGVRELRQMGHHGIDFLAPGVEVAGHWLWGATAMICAELAAVVEEAQRAHNT
jgi:8-oxo-dGTP pyrophosphatase MutT (NUDIX family)